MNLTIKNVAKVALIALAAVAIANRVPQVKTAVSGDDKFLGIF